MAISIRRLRPDDDRSRFRYEKLGFVRLETRAGLLGDRPEPLPMFLELGAIPRPER